MALSSVLILNGPNLNLLGSREPDIYGSATLNDHIASATAAATLHGVTIQSMQSNSESEIVDAVHAAAGAYDAIIINAGAFTHYSWALHDALRSFKGNKIEVHLSNPSAREEFRHVSVLAGVVDGSISGFGGLSYVLAIQALVAMQSS
jgi:3-dehydroquinate dehydratase II